MSEVIGSTDFPLYIYDPEVVVDYIKETLGGKIPETYKDPYGEGRITIK